MELDFKINGGVRGEELFTAARVLDVAYLGFAVYFNIGDKAVGTGDKSADYDIVVFHLCTSLFGLGKV